MGEVVSHADILEDMSQNVSLIAMYLYDETELKEYIQKNEDNKLTLVGQVLGAEMSEEDFATTVDALKNYYELSEITVNGNTGYKVHTEDESGTFDICIFHNGNTYLQIGLMNVSEDEVNTVINSVKF